MKSAYQTALLVLIIGWLSVSPAWAAGSVTTRVTVVHAADGPGHIDSGLSTIASELQSVFKYTSYRLIKTRTLDLKSGQNGQVSLPGGRTLILTPLQIKGKRIPYQIQILKKNRSVFQSRIQLNNNSSVTIGGPKYKNGVLLFNIRGSHR